jgi:hypothetical protein
VSGDDKDLQLEIYGKVLIGSETEDEKVAIARAQYLKMKLRRRLELENIGDPQDIVTDINKSLLLGVGILSGAITNPAIITRYKNYVTEQVQLYGGPAAIIDKLEANAVPLARWLAKLNAAKVAISAAKGVEAIMTVEME